MNKTLIFLALLSGIAGAFGFSDMFERYMVIDEVNLLGMRLVFSMIGTLACYILFNDILTAYKARKNTKG
jgi:hypothetical protein